MKDWTLKICGNFPLQIAVPNFDKYIPIQTVEPNSKPKWLNSFALKTIKQKHKAWNTYKATHQQSDYVLYTAKRNITTAAVKMAKSNSKL